MRQNNRYKGRSAENDNKREIQCKLWDKAKHWFYKGQVGAYREILPLCNCMWALSWARSCMAPLIAPTGAEHCPTFLPCAEGGYWQDFGLEPGSTLRAPGTGLRFAPLWSCFPPQCSSGSSPCWRSAERRTHGVTTHQRSTGSSGTCPKAQTCDWSFTMAASISELDSFNSLISLFSCLISSSFSRTVGGKAAGGQPLLLGKHRSSPSPRLCFHILNTECTSCSLFNVCFFVKKKKLTIIILYRSVCKCKSEREPNSWSPAHSCALQGWPPW